MILELRNIEKSFGNKQVLSNVSFAVESGKAFGLLGRNGAGKTTTIRILMGLFPANSGEILINGQPINYKDVKIGYLPEERGLYPKISIIDQLIYFAKLKGMNHKSSVIAADYWLERLCVTEYRNKRLQTLSKGNQQKIQLITALINNPDIVILDEPFSGLDPVNATLLKDVVKEQIQKGKLVLFSSHQMNYIEEFCDNIAILNSGKISLCGSLHNIKQSYIHNRLVVRTTTPEVVKADFGDSCAVMENNTLLIQLTSLSDKKEIMSKLVCNYDVDEVKVYDPPLNDIFIEYAGTTTGGI